MGVEMPKPVEKYPTGKMWIWYEIEAYYREVFGEDMRPTIWSQIHQDFWHVIVDACEPQRDSVGVIRLGSLKWHHRYDEEWCKKRVDWLFSEFDPEGTGYLTCWFSW